MAEDKRLAGSGSPELGDAVSVPMESTHFLVGLRLRVMVISV